MAPIENQTGARCLEPGDPRGARAGPGAVSVVIEAEVELGAGIEGEARVEA